MNYPRTVQQTGDTITATATFPANFPAFQGHFPGHPILPGFMHIQLALDILRDANLPHQLHEIENAKFSAPILPDATVTITLTPIAPNHYDVTVTTNNAPASTFALLTQ